MMEEQYADEYEIISVLGSGGQASVYLGRHGHSQFALKIYHSGASGERAYRR
jgi:serine/threonine protein kinase